MNHCVLILILSISLMPMALTAEEYGSEHFIWADSDIQLVWYSEFSEQDKDKLRNWMKNGLNLVRHLNGQLPRKEIRFHIQKKETDTKSPVPYAQVLRDGVQGVHFWVDTRKPYYDFIRDWTFTHELVHLFIDYPGDKDVWLSEGLATYYQNILLVRGGLLTERDFWRRFVEGLERGRDDSNYDGYPLQAVSEHMRGIGAYMRVYWSGALYFLQGSIALLEPIQHSDDTLNQESVKASDDKQALKGASNNLEQVLVNLITCCQNKGKPLEGIELVKKLDVLAKTNWFETHYEQFQYVDKMPEYESVLERLGIQKRGGYLYLTPENELRRKILFRR